MRKWFQDKNRIWKTCHIYSMLLAQTRQKRHISFHTPGHKRCGFDITELSYSDNLSAPKGCILRAQTDIATILGACKSFILTDGSTSGILSMLYAFAKAGYTRLAIPSYAHKSVRNGCTLCNLTPVIYTEKDLMIGLQSVLRQADGLLLVSPDYYGKIPDLQGIKGLCASQNKPLLIDGAHGGHLKHTPALYAGSVADMWVDGVHKSLPAYTQGAVVSAKTEFWAERLREAVDIFRTSSPSYPIMASVEYAVKYPDNPSLENAVRAYEHSRVVRSEDWTKFCVLGGKYAFEIEKALQKQGIYAEFCDGEIIEFYLSPATRLSEFKRLVKALRKVWKAYPYIETEHRSTAVVVPVGGDVEYVGLDVAVGRICAKACGVFPPCIPLLVEGETITGEKIALLRKANNVFGLVDGKIKVLKIGAEE